jgi:hypothetical protein
MRAIILLVIAIVLGLAGGYAWNKYSAHPRALEEAKAAAAAAPKKTSDEVEQSAYYANCDAVRAAGKAPLYPGQPGYRKELDPADIGVACPPGSGG